MRTCTLPDCTKPHRAKGLCISHYNAQDPNRHRPIVTNCAQCGDQITRSDRSTRWANSYCSELCRQWQQFGAAWKNNLPTDHWARMYGGTCEWQAPHIFDCRWCGSRCQSANRSATYCSRKHKLRASKARRRALDHNSPGEYSWSEVTRLWLTFNRACAYCDHPTPLHLIQAEHVTPLSRGGRNDLGNLLPSCGPCNADKRDLMLHEWNMDRARRNLSPVRTAWNNDSRYSHLVNTRSIGQAA